MVALNYQEVARNEGWCRVALKYFPSRPSEPGSDEPDYHAHYIEEYCGVDPRDLS